MCLNKVLHIHSMVPKSHLALSLFSCALASVSFLIREENFVFWEIRFYFSSFLSFIFSICMICLACSIVYFFFLCFIVNIVVVTIFPSRILGFVQLYIFLFTRLDDPPLSSSLSSLMENFECYDQIFLLLPFILTILLFLFDMIFLIIMFQF